MLTVDKHSVTWQYVGCSARAAPNRERGVLAEHQPETRNIMKEQGTLNSGTEVQRQTEMTDTELEQAFLAAMQVAEDKAGELIGAMHGAALRIVDLHQRQAWARIVDSEGKQVYSSPVAYYSHIASAEKFPKVHKTVRESVVTELFEIHADETGEIGMPIGVNELAALLNTDKSQVSITAKQERAKREAEQAEAEAEKLRQAKAEALEQVKAEAAASALAQAEKQGLAPEQAEKQAEQAVALIERMQQAEAEAERKQAEAKAQAEKQATERKATEAKIKRGKDALEKALKTVSSLRAEMTEADQVWLLTLVSRAVTEWTPRAEGEQAEGEQGEQPEQPEPEQPEAEQPEAEQPLAGAPTDPTGISAPRPSGRGRGRGRGKQAS